jgi:ubiquinone/menaquinone biosynthesis C-methylase UbiE
VTSFFDEAYTGSPKWDIGRPQDEFIRVAREGGIKGSVLDIGCGTGENAMFFASLGHEVWGLDAAPLAIKKAREKALQRGAKVNFVLGDALHLDSLGRRFDTVTDCGLFHVFSDEDRKAFAQSVRAALEASGTYFVLCFSDKEPTDWGGPRRVSEREIRETFAQGWRINYVREASFSITIKEHGAHALLSSISPA